MKNTEAIKVKPKSNVLAQTRTYLVGHMQYLSGRDWRKEVTEKLSSLKVTCFNPYKKPFVKDVEEDEDTRKQMESWMFSEDYDKVVERMKTIRSYDLNLVEQIQIILLY